MLFEGYGKRKTYQNLLLPPYLNQIKKTLETDLICKGKGELGELVDQLLRSYIFDLKDEKSILASIVWRGTRIIEEILSKKEMKWS